MHLIFRCIGVLLWLLVVHTPLDEGKVLGSTGSGTEWRITTSSIQPRFPIPSSNNSHHIANSTSARITNLKYASPTGISPEYAALSSSSVAAADEAFFLSLAWPNGKPTTSSQSSPTSTALINNTSSPFDTLGWSLYDNVTQAPYSDLREECILWNSSCTGNRTAALNEFFGQTLYTLGKDECWIDQCTDHVQEINAILDPVKSWMRTPACRSDQVEFHGTRPAPNTSYAYPSCCESCSFMNSDVEIYYWPDPSVHTDTSCLSIVGTDVYPVDYGATTSSKLGELGTYWGCSTSDDVIGPTVAVTAQLVDTWSMTFKSYLTNPYIDTRCGHTALPASLMIPPDPHDNLAYKMSTLYAAIAQSETEDASPSPPMITPRALAPARTLVSNGFTLYVAIPFISSSLLAAIPQ